MGGFPYSYGTVYQRVRLINGYALQIDHIWIVIDPRDRMDGWMDGWMDPDRRSFFKIKFRPILSVLCSGRQAKDARISARLQSGENWCSVCWHFKVMQTGDAF